MTDELKPLSMPRIVISVLFYLAASFCVCQVCAQGFVNFDAIPDKPPAGLKYAIMAGSALAAAVALLIGLVLTRFSNWQRDVGIVLLLGASMTVTAALGIFAIAMNANGYTVLPGRTRPLPPGFLDTFSDLATGLTCVGIVAMTGLALVANWMRKRPVEVEVVDEETRSV